MPQWMKAWLQFLGLEATNEIVFAQKIFTYEKILNRAGGI
jgi:hypothetical protein